MAKAHDKDAGGSGGAAGLRDVYLRHGINLTRYSNHEAQRLIKLLDAANTQIKGIITKAKAVETKEKYRRVAAEIGRVAKECGEQLNGRVEADFKELAEAETAFTAKALRGAGVKADFELPSAAKVWSAASFGSYADGHETFETYLNGLSDNLYKTWDTQVRAGYLTGMTAKEINRAVLGTADGLNPGEMQTLRRSLEMNTRTMVASMANTARNAVYAKNSKLFSGYRYVGTLDSRACLACAEMDGKVFKYIDETSPSDASGYTDDVKAAQEIEDPNNFKWTQEKVTELESTLRKSDDIFSNLSFGEAKSLVNEIQTNYPDKGKFARDVEKELERLEMSEKFTQMIRDNGIDIPKSNIKIDIERDMYKELMADPEKWIEYVKQSADYENGWGYAEVDNRFGQALIFVNGGEFRPLVKGELVYDFKGYTNVGDVAIALRSKNFAAENIKNVSVSELVRAERRNNSWITQLKKGDSILLSGVTSFTANERHLDHYTGLLKAGEFKGKGDTVVNYHLELNDKARKKAIFLQLDDCSLGNTDWSKCSEVALQGLSYEVEKTSYNEQNDIWDVYVKLK